MTEQRPEAFESILPPLGEDTQPLPATDAITEEDLPLIRRLLTFAEAQLPIEDQLGGKIYPTEETQKHANDLANRLEAVGIGVVPDMYLAFDPFTARDRIGTIHFFDGDYEYIIKGLITSVEQTEPDKAWRVRIGTNVAVFDTIEDFKANVRVELDPV